jgi:hypothetical protein
MSRYNDETQRGNLINQRRCEDSCFIILYCSCFPECQARFDYLLGLDPGALKRHNDANIPRLIDSVIADTDKYELESFGMAFKAGLQFFPEDLGFLFHENNEEKTAFQLAIERFGKDQTWNCVNEHFEQARGTGITDRNSVSNIYPFMHAASDLNATFYLVRRGPTFATEILEAGEKDCKTIKKKRRVEM